MGNLGMILEDLEVTKETQDDMLEEIAKEREEKKFKKIEDRLDVLEERMKVVIERLDDLLCEM